MPSVSLLAALEMLGDTQFVRWTVWVGLVVLTVALLLLIRTRWGQSQPLGKCIVLSLLAHLLLGIYTTTVNIVTETVGSPDGKGVQVALIDSSEAGTATSASSDSQPWNTFAEQGQGETPDLAASELLPGSSVPALPKAVEPERHSLASPSLPAAPIGLPEPAPQEETGPPALDSKIETPARPSVPPPTAMEVPSAEAEPVPPPDVPTAPEGDSAEAGGGKAMRATAPAGAGAAGGESTQPLVPVPKGSDGGAGLAKSAGRGAAPRALPGALAGRTGNHLQVAKGHGATQETEAAVQAGLRWLAVNQGPRGSWVARSLGAGISRAADGQDRQGAGSQADTGMTGLSLLAFLAAGHTHLQGPNQNTVRRGLEFLLAVQETDGCLGATNIAVEKMYCHAMATCAVSEAYAMTGDDRLQLAVRKAIGYTLAAQDRVGGGWRYRPGESGDTSQLGWQVMAIKSAQLAGVSIPDETRSGIARFLASVSGGRDGGLGRYQMGRPVSRPMTAEALVVRQFMNIPYSPAAAAEASTFVLQELPGDGITNHYYWYYATLSMYQLQGESWRRWNTALQRSLLSTQRSDGAYAGSWDPDPVWGGCGGRAYSTALSTLCLEVYYRFLPLHIEAAGRERRTK